MSFVYLTHTILLITDKPVLDHCRGIGRVYSEDCMSWPLVTWVWKCWEKKKNKNHCLIKERTFPGNTLNFSSLSVPKLVFTFDQTGKYLEMYQESISSSLSFWKYWILLFANKSIYFYHLKNHNIKYTALLVFVKWYTSGPYHKVYSQNKMLLLYWTGIFQHLTA